MSLQAWEETYDTETIAKEASARIDLFAGNVSFVAAGDKPPLRKVIDPDLSTLRDSQDRGFLELSDFVSRKGPGYHLLTANAGFGKTYLLNVFIEHMLFNNKDMKICMTAPTNKAVKVMEDMAMFQSTRLSYSTIHKLLGLKPRYNARGEMEFVRDKKADDPVESIRSIDLLIVDECSMLNDELFFLLDGFVNTNQIRFDSDKDLKIIYTGDPLQIPPVRTGTKETYSGMDALPLRPYVQAQYNIGITVLDEPIRTDADSPIFKYGNQVRERMDYIVSWEKRENILDENGLGVIFAETQGSEFVTKCADSWFLSENFKEDANYAKCVAYTNRRVDLFNDYIRSKMFGENPDKVMNGEKLIAGSPIMKAADVHSIMINKNGEFDVTYVKQAVKTVYEYEIKCYEAKVRVQLGGKSFSEEWIYVVHEIEEDRYQQILNYEKSMAMQEMKDRKSFGGGNKKKGNPWMRFIVLLGTFADIKYNYAVTAHISQGSSYQNVLLLEQDMISRNSNVVERNRIKYTGITRASEKVLIV